MNYLYLQIFFQDQSLSFFDSFNEELLIFKEFENFRDFQDGQIDQHTSNLGGNLFTSDILDKGEQQFTQNLSLLINIQLQEFRKSGSQVEDSKSRSV